MRLMWFRFLLFITGLVFGTLHYAIKALEHLTRLAGKTKRHVVLHLAGRVSSLGVQACIHCGTELAADGVDPWPAGETIECERDGPFTRWSLHQPKVSVWTTYRACDSKRGLSLVHRTQFGEAPRVSEIVGDKLRGGDGGSAA